jgi:multidrug efflux pump subunit AcrA (membrane-fusion protein)
LARTEANVGKMVIKAPMDGIVVLSSVVRNNELGQVREGDEVRAGQPFMFIVDPNSMVLMASVNQVDTEKLRMGMKAKIRLDAYADIEVPGTLEGIGAMSKTSTFRAGYVGEIPVRVRLDKMDPRIIPDLTASAEVLLNTEENALVLPRSAVFEENGGKYVFLQSPQGWLRTPVETGVSSYTEVAVHTGLKKGDVVALQRPM